VEVITNVVALAGTTGLEGVAGWSGPIAAALSINWWALKHAASMYEGAKEGIASMGGGEYRDEAWTAATEVQEWMGRLAVTNALLNVESDEPRRKQLEKYAAADRWELIDQILKPYFVKLFGSGGKQDDEGSVGLRARLRAIVPLVDSAGRSGSDTAALEAGTVFLETVKVAFEEWGKVVLAKQDPTRPEQFVGRFGVVIKKIWNMYSLPPGVVHIRNDADKVAGAPRSVSPDEGYFRARFVDTAEWSNDLLPGQVVRVVGEEKGELWVGLASLQTPTLTVTDAEKTAADGL
jgi:hypothetical protein